MAPTPIIHSTTNQQQQQSKRLKKIHDPLTTVCVKKIPNICVYTFFLFLSFIIIIKHSLNVFNESSCVCMFVFVWVCVCVCMYKNIVDFHDYS